MKVNSEGSLTFNICPPVFIRQQFCKEKPKKVTFLGTDGRHYPFLCKAEKRGDLRKENCALRSTSNHCASFHPCFIHRNTCAYMCLVHCFDLSRCFYRGFTIDGICCNGQPTLGKKSRVLAVMKFLPRNTYLLIPFLLRLEAKESNRRNLEVRTFHVPTLLVVEE